VTTAQDLHGILRKTPAGVWVVTVASGTQRIGLTVATVVSLSLEPPLVGFAVARGAALHELLREARTCAFSLLAADQQSVAEHFARGVPPIAMWEGIAARDGPLGAPLLEGALGWLDASVVDELATGTHTFFVCAVSSAEVGADSPPLVRREGDYG
jgi:3-hydroxy-9,10-secoandrosta-1,3,5(10)-triene-9,17-dione monooxygenase reductase component